MLSLHLGSITKSLLGVVSNFLCTISLALTNDSSVGRRVSMLSSASFHLSLGLTLNSSIPSLFDSNRVDSISFSLNLNGIYFHTTLAGPNTHSSIPTRILGQSPLIRYRVKLSGVPSMLNVIVSSSSSIRLSFFHHDLLLRLPLVVMLTDLATSLLTFTNSKKLAWYIGSPKLPQKLI